MAAFLTAELHAIALPAFSSRRDLDCVVVHIRVMNAFRQRDVKDVLLTVVDRLKGFPEAITAVFPPATVQICIVHPARATAWISYPGRTESLSATL